jgi:sulfur carrier protein
MKAKLLPFLKTEQYVVAVIRANSYSFVPFVVEKGFLMLITLNGQKKDIPTGLTVKGLLEHLDIKPERVAVEINEEIVRKATYAETAVKVDDRVEVVQFMGGG